MGWTAIHDNVTPMNGSKSLCIEHQYLLMRHKKHCHAIACQGEEMGRGFYLYPPFIKYVGWSSPTIARIFWRMLKNFVSIGALDIA
jgi:hypothetical protein